MTAPSVLVLGAGMIGTCTALHLRQRGMHVTLVDRRGAGEETSYGNAGIIQREAVEPYPFPRELGKISQAAFGLGADIHYHWGALAEVAPSLLRYYRASAPTRYAPIARAYAALIRHCTDEHERFIDAAGAADLVRRTGFHHVFRTRAALDEYAAKAERVAREHDVRSEILDGAALAADEPALRPDLAGAIRWLDPWTVSDPGELVRRYAKLFAERGGTFVTGDAATLAPAGSGWSVRAADGATLVEAEHAVVALGPWSDALVRKFGYRLPLFVKRGYHRHYEGGVAPRRSLLDAERGYCLAPMARGTRLTTGAEFAAIDSPATPVQLARCDPLAREITVDLGAPVEAVPWLGARPCTIDMLPVMGPAPKHRGLWFNFGHAHQGFTLGPVAGRLLAELMTGETPWIDPAPYAATRFHA